MLKDWYVNSTEINLSSMNLVALLSWILLTQWPAHHCVNSASALSQSVLGLWSPLPFLFCRHVSFSCSSSSSSSCYRTRERFLKQCASSKSSRYLSGEGSPSAEWRVLLGLTSREIGDTSLSFVPFSWTPPWSGCCTPSWLEWWVHSSNSSSSSSNSDNPAWSTRHLTLLDPSHIWTTWYPTHWMWGSQTFRPKGQSLDMVLVCCLWWKVPI
jgi:hypothetical protein